MLISQDSIFIHPELHSQAEVFQFIAQKAVELNVANNADSVLTSLQEREAQGTTGMMDGFSIPHAKSTNITSPKIVIIKLADGLDWNSMDGEPTTFVISMLIPDGEAGTTHLKLLAQIARMLMKSDVKEALQNATTASQIETVLAEQLQA